MSTPNTHDRAERALDGQGWAWVRAAQSGDREAFGRLYQHYRPSITRFLRSRLAGDYHLVEDLTSETFARAYGALGTLSERCADPGAWLSRIARNLVFDHAKSAGARRERVTGEVPEPRAGTQAPPSLEEVAAARADRRAAAATVARCVARLTPDQRQLVELYELAPTRSVAATATAMDRAPAAVRTLRQRALAAMRHQLASEGLTCTQDCSDAAERRGARARHARQRDGAEDARTDPDNPAERCADAVSQARAAVRTLAGQPHRPAAGPPARPVADRWAGESVAAAIVTAGAGAVVR